MVTDASDCIATSCISSDRVHWSATGSNRRAHEYLLTMIDMRLPTRQIDVSRLHYDRKHGIAPPGTRVDLRYAAIRADLKLPTRAQHDAFEDAVGAAEILSCARGDAGAQRAVVASEVRSSRRLLDRLSRHRHAVSASLSRMAHRGFCGLSIEDKIPTTRRSRALAMSYVKKTYSATFRAWC
jgi:hypothetical protein